MKNFLKLVMFSAFVLCANIVFAQNPVSWKASAEKIDNNTYQIIFEANIAGNWHLYDIGPYEDGPNATTFTFETPAGVTLDGGMKMLDKPKKVYDEMFDMEIGYFEGKARFVQKVKYSSANAVVIKAAVEWMVCDDSQCLPPEDKDFEITLDGGKDTEKETIPSLATTPNIINNDTSESNGNETDVVTAAATEISETPVSKDESDKSLWGYIIEAILWGLAAIVTPCVFPMIPMTVSFFMKDSENKAKGKINASLYGFFIILLYTLPIAIIILLVRILGGDTVTADMFNWLATHWLPNLIFFFVFMVFAASFFGAFEITLPSWMVNKSDRKADKGGLAGIFFLALTLVLVSFSCTGPIVSTILIKATAGEFWMPIVVMLVFSTVFALPFILAALFPSLLNKLPKSGGWLNSVKVVLGFIEVALGLKFLSTADRAYHWGILDREIYLAIWIVVFTLLGLYLLGKIKFAHDSDVKHVSVWRLALAIITFSFVVYLIPGMWGAPLKRISGYLPPLYSQDFVIRSNSGQDTLNAKYSDFLHLPDGFQGFFDLKEAEAYAAKVDKPIFIDFTGGSCNNCREMEQYVWTDPKVSELLRNEFVILALYMDDRKELPESDWLALDNGKTYKNLAKINSYIARTRYKVAAMPTYIIQGKNGKVLLPPRAYNLDVAAFVEFLKKGIEEYKKQ